MNLGHTFGHALESSTRFSAFSHGAAVAWGTVRALEAESLLESPTRNTLLPPPNCSVPSGMTSIIESDGEGSNRNHLSKDKKKLAEGQFVLLRGSGKPELHLCHGISSNRW